MNIRKLFSYLYTLAPDAREQDREDAELPPSARTHPELRFTSDDRRSYYVSFNPIYRSALAAHRMQSGPGASIPVEVKSGFPQERAPTSTPMLLVGENFEIDGQVTARAGMTLVGSELSVDDVFRWAHSLEMEPWETEVDGRIAFALTPALFNAQHLISQTSKPEPAQSSAVVEAYSGGREMLVCVTVLNEDRLDAVRKHSAYMEGKHFTRALTDIAAGDSGERDEGVIAERDKL